MARYSICIIIAVLIAVLISGCGAGNEVYVESRESQPLVVPADLDRPSLDAALLIPGQPAPQLAGRAEAKPPLVLSSEEAAQISTNVRYGDGALYLLVPDEMASVSRRLGFTLNRSGMNLDSRNEQEKRFAFSYRQPPNTIVLDRSFWDTVFFWRNTKPADYSGSYQIKLLPDDDPQQTRVYLYDHQGQAAPAEAADHLFGIIQQRLG